MGKKIITIELSEDSINKAIKELEQYKKDIIRKTNILRQRVAEHIANTAQSGFNGAIVDDLLKGGAKTAQVDVKVDEQDNVSIIIANGEDAIWVEFGAGVYHNGQAGSSPHPKGNELGFTIGGYGKGMGKRDTWVYYEDGDKSRKIYTHGTPATMPMYNAVKQVVDHITAIAREVFK
ncbi:MAG: hypothetical protein ACK5L6_13560 [Anaerorhabdus sp.]|uniref:hypothetical protein n=1 Tax=Anaerorhabdus sp. TaxID=1872524 RepID=UPI003A8584A6